MRWKPSRFTTVSAITISALLAFTLLMPRLQASLLQLTGSTLTEGSFDNKPLNGSNLAAPLVMLTLSRDHQLHYKAYNDYSDLDGDGLIDTTYNNNIEYYGYFDPYKCYTYDTSNSNNWFAPSSLMATPTTISTTAPHSGYYCSNAWSGNFMNWASMTRMDAVRKLLYGGLRSTDTDTNTVLERAYLPMDAHAFAKWYNGTDVAQLVPNNVSSALLSTASTVSATTVRKGTSGAIAAAATATAFATTSNTYLAFVATALSGVNLGDQIQFQSGTSSMVGWVTQTLSVAGITYVIVYVPTNSSTGNATSLAWTITDLSSTGISFCNVTPGSSSDGTTQYSETNNNAPQIRVAKGNYELWAANERWQCNWYSEQSNTNGGNTASSAPNSNGNQAFFSQRNASAENPTKAAAPFGEYNARIQVAVYGKEGKEKLRSYPTTNTTYPSGVEKPIGLLQTYSDRIRFGLITTSYDKNISGGVLRKALPSPSSTVTSLSDEINITTNGSFKASPPPNTSTANSGIIDTLNKLRPWGYNYNDGTYNGSGSVGGVTKGDSCNYGLVGFTTGTADSTHSAEGKCVSWGNPFGEAYIETLRYLGVSGSSRTGTSAFAVTSTSGPESTLGLTTASWTSDPLDNTNYCASINVLGFNASVSSYDNDQASAALATLAGAPTLATQTNTVGSTEGINGQNWFIGDNSAGGYNALCTVKALANLSSALGICPEAPVLNGSYGIAGAAYWAHTNRIRTDLTVPTTDSTSLKVSTYGIQLATSTPQIKIVVGTGTNAKTVTLLPAARSASSLTAASAIYGTGTLVDFRVIAQSSDGTSGSFYVNWEDSAQGFDYDQDLWGIISYTVSGTTLNISTQVIAKSTPVYEGFGYVISGTNHDGAHFHSGINGFTFTDSNAGTAVSGSAVDCRSSSGCNLADSKTTVSYTVNGNSAGVLNDPLWYAAKYGGFDERFSTTKNSLPDLTSEWDTHKTDGTVGTDGIPDNYFLVTNPNQLEKSLDTALRSILAKTGSGTAAAVVANALQGQGAVYQSIYVTSRTDSKNNSASWIGTLHALFVDSNGNLREDGNNDGKLQESNFTTDPAVRIFYDPSDNTTKVQRFTRTVTPTTSFNAATDTIASLDDLKTLWNARKQLSALTDVTTQRTYATQIAPTSSTGGRYIFTYLDLNGNGVVDSNEVKDFVPATFGNGTYGILNVPNTTSASTLVNYVRGDESQNVSQGLRNRTLDYDNNGTTEVMRLGDIVDSTPTEVSAPSEAYDLLYSDTTYSAFRTKYARRRNVIYVGSNDGMLHAFNGGFYNPSTKSYDLTGGATEVQHPLGAELWAYVPYNLLSHLYWLQSSSYDHVWYMDGKPRIFDARVFTADTTHPNGWGTVMVVGMRFGGGPISLNVGSNASAFTSFTTGSGSGSAITAMTQRSSYVVMDITDPEQAPTLMAEITDPTGNLGFTTSYPTVASFSDGAASPTTNKWYLIFGSGPTTDNASFVSPATGTGGSMGDSFAVLTANTAKLYVYDLATKAFVKNGSNNYFYDLGSNATTGAAASFVGDPVTVDWNLNFKADSLYFGTIGGTAAAPSGKLFKLDFNPTHASGAESATPSAWTAPVVLLDPGNPVIATPSVTQDEKGRHWVMAGTGRYYSKGDKSSTPTQSLFGVIDNLPVSGTVTAPSFSTLYDVTGAKVSTAGDVQIGSTATTQNALITSVQTSNGWKRSLATGTGTPSERNVNQTALLGGTLFATGFTPSNSSCGGDGSSNLYCMYYKTGTGNANLAACGTTSGTLTSGGATVSIVNSVISLGTGLGASPSLHLSGTGSAGNGKLTVITQTSTGAITQIDTVTGQGPRSGEIDWREIHR